MKWHYISPLVVFFIVLLAQILIVPLLSIAGIIPDLVLIALVYYSISRNQLYGTVLGATYGLLIDLITGTLLGSSMLAKTMAGFSAGYFASETKKEKNTGTYNFSFIVLLCALVNDVVYSFFSAFDVQANIITLFFEQALLPALYTAVVSVILVLTPFRRRKI